MPNNDNKTTMLIEEINSKKDDRNSVNPLDAFKKKKKKTLETQKEIEADSQDPNKVKLLPINKIGELIIDGVEMHNRSGMSTKDEEELAKFAKSLKEAEDEGIGLYNTGLIHAITVRPSRTKENDYEYERIIGYRRIKSFEINGKEYIPAIIVDVDDKTARRLRNAENKQRRALNAYDETFGDLEEIQLYCDIPTLEETKKKINRATNILKKEKAIFKNMSMSDISEEDYERIINEKSSTSLEEHKYAKNLAEIVLTITQKTISTFCKRLEILNISDTIKAYLLNSENTLPKPISYSEALSLKKVAKDNDELVHESVKWLESEEKQTDKRPSSVQFEKWLKNKAGYVDKNRGNNNSELKNTYINTISLFQKYDIDSLTDDKKIEAAKIINKLKDLHTEYEKLYS